MSSQIGSDFSSRESRGVAVLAKCVNPVCCAQFRYLHHGKLFEVEVQYRESEATNGHRKFGNGKGHIERYWLCDQCAEHVTLRFEKRQGLVMRPPVGLEEVIIPLSSSRTLAEIWEVRIRPLDLNFAGKRDLTGDSKVRRKAA